MTTIDKLGFIDDLLTGVQVTRGTLALSGYDRNNRERIGNGDAKLLWMNVRKRGVKISVKQASARLLHYPGSEEDKQDDRYGIQEGAGA